jgi:hypothetical protein
MKGKQGLLSLGQVSGIVLVLVTIGIMLVVGLRVESDLQADFTVNGTEWNASENAMEGLSNVAENQGLLGTIIVFGVILGVVVMAFAVGRRV